MEKNKSNNLTVCILCGILTLLGVITAIVGLCTGEYDKQILNIINLILSVLIGYYAFFGYQKPHGNLLKYIILIYAASYLSKVYFLAQQKFPLPAVLITLTIGICCYVAGRLYKIKENMILMIPVTLIFVIMAVIGLSSVDSVTVGILTPLIIWIDICAAYLLRYKDHKLAGLMDKEK